MDKTKNLSLCETAEGRDQLATELTKIWADIKSARRKLGHYSKRWPSAPSDFKRFVVGTLNELAIREKPVPPKLVALVGELLGTSDYDRARNRIRFPLAKAKKIKEETGLKGRALARELRERGINVSDRSVARYEKKDFVPQKI